MKISKALPLAFVIVITACNQSTTNKEADGDQTSSSVSKVASSDQGVVVSGHPLATRAGVKMLEMGGNAFDAAVATAFALSVVEPSMSGLGGRLQAILRTKEGEIIGIDASTQVPESYNPDTSPKAFYGYPTIGIPGVLKGLSAILNDYGALPLSTVMEPAIDYAEKGYYMLPGKAELHSRVINNLKEFPGTKKYFISGDTTYQAGELIVQKDLANTLRLIAERGESVFYEGEIADKIVEDMKANGGYLDKESLAAYKVNKSKVLYGNYRGHDLFALWMPSFGAITIEMLHILENLPMEVLGEADWANAIYQANDLAYRDRHLQFNEDNAELLVSKEYAKVKADSISLRSQVDSSLGKLGFTNLSWLSVSGYTSHLSVSDKDGNVIALTQSIGPIMGSKVATDGLGFVYATTMGGYLGGMKPRQRASSHISPTLILKNGQPYLILGAAGGSRIVTAIVQTVSRFIDRNMSLEDAIAAGRVHSVDTAMSVEFHQGSSWTEKHINQFENLGIEVVKESDPINFAWLHAIYYHPTDKSWTGAADPDWEGTSLSPQK